MKSILLLFGILVVILTIVVSSLLFQEQGDSIFLGAILPLSGELSSVGEELTNGIGIAASEINEKGINGKRVRILYEDSRGMPSDALRAASRLIHIEGVKIILGPAMSSGVLSISPVAEENEVIVISPTASAASISHAGEYVFRIWPSDEHEVTEFARFIYENLVKKRGSILYIGDDFGESNSRVFKKVFEEQGGDIIFDESYNVGSTDFKTQLLKIKAANPDFIYLVSGHQSGGLIVKQARELGINTQFFSTAVIKNPEFLEIAGDSAEGIVYSISSSYDPENHASWEFKKLFEQEYNREPSFIEALGYDLLKIIAAAMERCSDPHDSECIKGELLNTVNYEGATGLTTFDENGDVKKPVIIEIVSNGEFVKYSY